MPTPDNWVKHDKCNIAPPFSKDGETIADEDDESIADDDEFDARHALAPRDLALPFQKEADELLGSLADIYMDTTR